VYLQENFAPTILNQSILLKHVNKALTENRPVSFTLNKKNTIIAPLMLKYSKIGFWFIQDDNEMPFTNAETKLISNFSFHLSGMLIRMYDFEAMNEKASILQRVVDITSNMMQTYNIEKLEYDLIKNSIELTHATRGFLVKKDAQGNYYFSIALDSENHLISNASNFSKTAVGDVLSTRIPLYIENNLYDIHTLTNIHSIDNQANSLYCAPIVVENEIYALVYLDNFGDDETSLRINKEMMGIFLTQVSLTFTNAITYKSLLTKNWELLMLDSMKNDFIGIVSHELNTPLITLHNYIQKLKKNINPIEIEANDLITKVDKSTQKLISTIQDIITLNVYNTRTELVKEKTNLVELLEEIYKNIQEVSKERRMKIILESEPDLPFVKIESKAISTLINNLLKNAIRFTADYGTIILGVRRASFSNEKIEDTDSIIIYVQDNGIGIPENEIENIFKAFYELGDIFSHRSGFLEFRSGGLGIGLAIARRIVDLHEGKIWINSKEREGTTVFVALPT